MPPHALSLATRTELSEQPPDLVVIPVGALEQHGPHLPVGTDTFQVESIAHLAAERADGHRVVVAPPVAFGCSDHHLPFGGTLSLSTSTLLAVLRDLIRTASASGFERVFILNGHGGNQEVVVLAARDGAQEFGIAVGAGSWWEIARAALVDAGAADGALMPGHAGGFETAMMTNILDRTFDRLPPPSVAFGATDPRSPAAAYRTERPTGWSDTDGYTDDPAVFDGADGARFLDIAATVVGESLARFVRDTPTATTDD